MAFMVVKENVYSLSLYKDLTHIDNRYPSFSEHVYLTFLHWYIIQQFNRRETGDKRDLSINGSI